MASNLLIAYPQVQKVATITLSTGSEDTLHKAINLQGGARTDYFQWSSTVSNPNIKFTLTSAVACDYFIIARANLLKKEGITGCILESSPDNAAWTTRLGTSANFQTRTFNGVRSEDIIFTSTYNSDAGTPSASTFSYWRYSITTATASKLPHCKFYCGTLFDIGQDPVWLRQIERSSNIINPREVPISIGIRWEGITDSNRNLFLENIAKYSDTLPIFLYTSTYHDVMFDYRLFHCVLKKYQTYNVFTDSNVIEATFEELI